MMSSVLQRTIAALCSQVRWLAVGHHLPVAEPLSYCSRFYAKDCGDKKKKKKRDCGGKKKEKKKDCGGKKKEKKRDCGTKKKKPKKDNSCVLSPIPKKRHPDVVEHMMGFLRTSQLSRCFKDKGQREKQFCQWVTNRLNEGLSSAVLVGMDKKQRGGCIVAACLARVLPCERIHDADVLCFGKKDDDPFLLEIKRMFLTVHKRLDLFDQLCVKEILDLAFVTEDRDYKGKGYCKNAIKASLNLGVNKGLKAVKADAANMYMAKCVQRACLSEVFTMEFCEYQVKGKVVFPDTEPPNDKLRVYAGMLSCDDPYVTPVKIKIPKKDDCK